MRGWLALCLVGPGLLGPLAGCEAEEVTLVVQLRTDLVPGLEFSQTRVLLADPSLEEERPATFGAEGFLTGRRIAELDAVPSGSRALTVVLRDDAGAERARREVLADVRRDIAVTVLVTRDCESVSCPAPGDAPELTSCLGGQCVAPSCSSGEESSCGTIEAECAGDSDCPGDGACGRGACSLGLCLTRADDALCQADEACQPGVGCVPRPDAPDGWELIEAGQYHTCGVHLGAVLCWGDNASGQLGNGAMSRAPVPVPVAGLPAGTITAISAGASHSCAVVDGDAWCWGSGGSGELGDDAGRSSSSPVAVMGMPAGEVMGVSAGDRFTCAHTAADVYCWGANGIGQLGNGTTSPTTIAQRVTGTWSMAPSSITSGQDHACALVGETGWCWGHNDYGGALGRGTSGDSSIPVEVVNVQLTDLSIAGWHGCGVDTVGGAWCWGRGDNGILGDGLETDSAVPVAVQTLDRDVTAIETGGGPTPSDMSCAIQRGRVVCWGNNQNGRCGVEPAGTSVTVPTEVPGVTTARAVSVGYWHTCAILDDATARCWGRGDSGQLGDGELSDSTAAVVVTDPS